MTTIRMILIASLLVPVAPVASHAAEPVTTIHRQNVQEMADDGTYLGRSTLGRFVVHVPITFNDITIRATDPEIGEVVTHVIGAKTTDGFRFTALATERTKRMKDVDARTTLASMDKTGGMEIETVRKNGVDMFIGQIREAASSAYVLTARTDDRSFTVICEYPNAQAELGQQFCPGFVRSLEIE